MEANETIVPQEEMGMEEIDGGDALDWELLRLVTHFYYDYQDIRIKFNNRRRDIIRKLNEGIGFDVIEDKKEQKGFDRKYSDANLSALMIQLEREGKLTKKQRTYFDKLTGLVEGQSRTRRVECKHCNKKFNTKVSSGGVLETEESAKRLMARLIKEEEVYARFLSKIKGLGPVLSVGLLYHFGDCSDYENVSKLWAYTGYAVKEGKAIERKKGKKLGYNVQTKSFVWKISHQLMKQNKGYFRKLYIQEKAKQLNREYPPGVLHEKWSKKRKDGTDTYPPEAVHITLNHAHNRALRKVGKRFLSLFWEASRDITGQEIRKTYVEKVLGHDGIISWEEAVALEDTYLEKEA